jgi:hypothetical protein
LGQILLVDSDFEIISVKPIPWYNAELNSAKYIDDNSYLLTGKKLYLYNIEYEWDMGLLKFDNDENLLDSLSFGKQDTVDTPGIFSNLDFVDASNIYYGGFSNVDMGNPYYSQMPSWIILNKLDENLSLKWQKFYGGDACYNLWAMIASQDGGCIMAGTRYDYLTQNQERDVYILKVNEDGLITWAHNVPMVKKEIIVYPNPGRDKLMVKSSTDNLIFELYNSSGKKLITHELQQPESEINTTLLKPGIFVYKIKNKKGQIVETGKWIKK